MSGSLQSMGSILRNNRNLLRKRGVLKKDSTFLSARKEYLKAANGTIDFKNISNKELQLLREKVIKNRKTENLRIWLISLAISIPIIVFGFYLSYEFIENKNRNIYDKYSRSEKEQQIIIEKESNKKLDNYYYLIGSGDTWIEKKNWKNAIYQYGNAIKIFPEKYEANYRLALAYSYNCSFEGKDCDVGNKLTDRILKYFPENPDLQKLKTIFVNDILYYQENSLTIKK